MVRRGSTVRVRQRALVFRLLSGRFRSPGWRRPPVSASTQRPPWPLPGAQFVEQADRVLASVAGEVAVMAVDHGQAGAHVAGEVEGGDAGTEREGREGVPEIVDPAQRLDPGGTLGRLPLAVAEVVEVEVAAPLGREEQRAVRTRRLAFDGVQCDRLQRHLPPARLRLRALQPTLRERAASVDDTRLTIDVAPLEREPLGWTKSGRGREDHHRPVAGAPGSRRPRLARPRTRTVAAPCAAATGCRRRAWPR